MWPWRRAKPVNVEPAALRGKPARTRTKTYSAQSGYAYQYLYLGWRPLGGEAGQEYLFEVQNGRLPAFTVCVQLPAQSLQGCEGRIGRAISATEQYGVVKLSLFAAFDEKNTPAELAVPVGLSAADVEMRLGALGRLE